MINHRRIFLVLFDLLLTKNRWAYSKPNDASEWTDEFCRILTPKGLVASLNRMDRRATNLPALVQNPLRAAHGFFLKLAGNYWGRTFFLELADGDLHHLTHGSGRVDDDFARLVDFFAPRDSEHRIWPDRWQCAYILFLIPDSWPTGPEQVSSHVANLWNELNLTHMAPIPEVFVDLLVLPGQVHATAEKSLHVVWLDPPSKSEEETDLTMPATLLDLASYILYTQVVRDLTRRLRHLPSGPAEAGKWLEIQNFKLLESYLSRHFRERHLILNELLACTQDFRALEAEMHDNYIANVEGVPAQAWPEIVTHRYKFRYSRSLRRKRHAAREEYENIRSSVEKWSPVVAEYLRDLINGQVAASNLSLQRTIKRLTVSALIITTLVSFIPDTVRASVWRLIFGVQTHQSGRRADTSPPAGIEKEKNSTVPPSAGIGRKETPRSRLRSDRSGWTAPPPTRWESKREEPCSLDDLMIMPPGDPQFQRDLREVPQAIGPVRNQRALPVYALPLRYTISMSGCGEWVLEPLEEPNYSIW